MFCQASIPFELEGNVFEELSRDVIFEPFGRGRRCAVGIERNADGGTAMVRSTTKFLAPHQCMPASIRHLSQRLCGIIPGARFNNALIEQYTHEYRTMGAHSDMALDLADDSWICLFTCYDNPSEPDLRQLVVFDKARKKEQRFLLHHCSAVWFSTADNCTHKHAILPVGDDISSRSTWLGITFRCSKRSVTHRDGRTFLETGEELVMATDRQLYKERGEENATCGPFEYSEAVRVCTVSPSDLMLF